MRQEGDIRKKVRDLDREIAQARLLQHTCKHKFSADYYAGLAEVKNLYKIALEWALEYRPKLPTDIEDEEIQDELGNH